MAVVYILFDPAPLENVPESSDPLLLFDKIILGVFAHHFHAVNEREKIEKKLGRPIYNLKYTVCDPAMIICKSLDKIIEGQGL